MLRPESPMIERQRLARTARAQCAQLRGMARDLDDTVVRSRDTIATSREIMRCMEQWFCFDR
jgi:hypothetical protein